LELGLTVVGDPARDCPCGAQPQYRRRRQNDGARVRRLSRCAELAAVAQLLRVCDPAVTAAVQDDAMTEGSPSMRRIAILVAAMLLVLGACGNDGDETEVGAATTTTTTVVPATTTTPVPTTTATTRTRATTTTAAVTRDCATVGFTPNSEDAASSIKATGLPCAEAEDFVRIAGRRTSVGGPAQLDVEGYHCVQVRTVQEPLPQAFYECTNGPKKVTFVRS
jgi:hypothetical protein